MKSLSSTALGMPPSGIRRIMEQGFQLPDAIHLEAGEPDFDTPEHIVNAGIHAMQSGCTKYTPSAGFVSLREAIIEKARKENQIDALIENVIVTTGGVGGLTSAILTIVQANDEVLIPDPGWPNFFSAVALAGGIPITYSLDPGNGYLPSMDELRTRISRRTKLMIINSPSNPTGAVFPPEVMRELVEFAVEHDIYLMSDEVYERFIFEGEHLSPARICEDGRVISIFSLSKTYAMTGWRVGFVIADKKIINLMKKLQEPLTSCVSSISQMAAENALRGPQTCVSEMRESYRARRDLAVKKLESSGASFHVPNGAFYILADISESGLDSQTFAQELLTQMKVAVAPGTAFGNVSKNSVRISLATEKTQLLEGLDRMCNFIESKS